MKGYTISLLSALAGLAVASTTAHVPTTSEYVPTPTLESYAPSQTSDHVPPESPYPKPEPGNFTAVVGPEGVELRLPVHVMQQQRPDSFNLFVLAMDALQKLPESATLSYYQLAGIHGRPWIAWEYPTPPTGNYPYGYCTHDSVIFGTWHRPYLSLFEQLLVDHAVEIAAQFKGEAGKRYRDAAKKVRLPYWDWASDDTGGRIPDVVAAPQVEVTKPGPDGEPTTVMIRNPLYSYIFTNDQFRATYFAGIPQAIWNQTYRRPEGVPPVSRNDLSSAAIASTFTARKLATFQLFSIGTFSRFSTTRYMNATSPIDFASVEQIHNTIHGAVGFGPSFGHMSSVHVAAFDPIFWLHHAQVDRLMAMYQAIYPGRIVEPLVRTELGFAFPQPGGIEDVDTKLYPFRHPNGEEFTSRDVSYADSTWKYGYAYPEVPFSFRGQSAAALSAFTAEAMQKLYAPAGQGFTPSPGTNGTSTRNEYLLHVTFDESQIDGTFSLLVYAGELPTGDELVAHANLVGGITSFTGGHQSHRSIISGTVPLTQALIEKDVAGNGTSHCVGYLRDNLRWKIMRGTTEVPFDQLPSLQVGVSRSVATYYDDHSKLPTYGDWEIYYNITNNKQGGLRSGYHDPSYNGQPTAVPTKKVRRSFSS